MSGHQRHAVEHKINQFENKPDQETWMKLKQSFNKLETELDELTKKYPEQAKLRKIPDNPQGAKTLTTEDENINTVMSYMKKVQTYRPDSKMNTEQLFREFLDMVDCLLYLRSIDSKQQSSAGKHHVTKVDVIGKANSGTGELKRDIDEKVSDSKNPKQVFSSDHSKTLPLNQTMQSKDNSFSKTVHGSTSATGETSKNQNQQPNASSKGGEKNEDRKKCEKGAVSEAKKKFESGNLSKPAMPYELANQSKDILSKSLPPTKQIKYGIQMDEKQHKIAEGGKEEEKKDKKNIDKKNAEENKVEESQKTIRELEDKIKKMEKDEKELNEKYNLSEIRNKSLDEKNKQVEGLNQQLKSRVKFLEEENRTVNVSNQELNSRLSEREHYLQQQNQELQGCQGQNEYLRFRIDDLQSRNAEVEQENKYLKEQVDELTMRLSSFASKQLSEGNPNVADLSDQNRPTKIGEKFGSLYDDEWSEAYDALSNNEDRSEEDIIQYLIKIIQESYKFCESTAKTQLQKLNEKMKTLMTQFEYKDSEGGTHETTCSAAENKSIDSARAKYARDYRKAAAAESLLGVQKMFKETKLKEELEKFSGEEKDAIISYIDKCTELIWFMVVQDPPMVFDIPEPGRPFNDHAFKPYKIKGKFVKLAVWPAVKLCDNGGLISKGYALPK